jgi:hypothetical protein
MKNLTHYLLLALTIIIFHACKEDEDHGLKADAGEDRQEEVGRIVNLNAEASTDQQGTGFDSQWQFVSIPSGSDATIENADSSAASFVPDVQGDYVIRLTISNSIGSSSDQVVITAIASAAMEIGGSYNEPLHLTNIVDRADSPDYIVTSNISMSARLIIDPGVRIEVTSDKLIRITTNGIVEINGTESEPVVITGTTNLPGFWRGINVESNNLENKATYLQISASGSSTISSGRPKTAIHIENGSLSISHSTITKNDGFGVSVHQPTARLQMENNEFSENQAGAMAITAAQIKDIDSETRFNSQEILISGSNINLGTDHIWPAASNGTYRFTSQLSISDNVTIQEGAQMVFDNDVLLRFINQSSLKVMGTADNQVVFKGKIQQPGAWRGIMIETPNLENTIKHARFAHAGHSNLLSGYGKAAIGLSSGARANFSNVHFDEIDGFGIYLRYDNSRITTNSLSFGNQLSEGAIRMNTIHISNLDTGSNMGGNYVVVNGGNLPDTEDVIWPKLMNGKYLFNSGGNVYGKITIQPGTIMEFDSDILLRIQGVIVADGTSADPIVFTRKEGTSVHWKGINIEGSSIENLINFAEVSYGGNSTLLSGYGQTNIGIATNGRLTLTNSTISNSLGYGIYPRSGATLTQSDNTFSNNASGDIFEP